MEEVEGVNRNPYFAMGFRISEIHHNEENFVVVLAHKSIFGLGREYLAGAVDIHKVECLALRNGFFLICKTQNFGVFLFETVLCGRHSPSIPIAMIKTFDGPIVENGCPSVAAGESFFVHGPLTELLPGIYHHRIALEHCSHYQCRNAFHAVAGKEVGGKTLFVMILKEVEHVTPNVVGELPFVRY